MVLWFFFSFSIPNPYFFLSVSRIMIIQCKACGCFFFLSFVPYIKSNISKWSWSKCRAFGGFAVSKNQPNLHFDTWSFYAFNNMINGFNHMQLEVIFLLLFGIISLFSFEMSRGKRAFLIWNFSATNQISDVFLLQSFLWKLQFQNKYLI